MRYPRGLELNRVNKRINERRGRAAMEESTAGIGTGEEVRAYKIHVCMF